jgi:hypothetical protein
VVSSATAYTITVATTWVEMARMSIAVNDIALNLSQHAEHFHHWKQHF